MSSSSVTEKCFICKKDGNLTKSPLHCGKSYYHQTCINEYCEKKKAIICPECKKNITNKFIINSTSTLDPSCGCKCSDSLKSGIFTLILILLFLSNIFFAFWTYSILPEPSHYVVGRLVAMFFISLASIIAAGWVAAAFTLGPNTYSGQMGTFILVIYDFIFGPLILLLMSLTSLSNENLISAHTVGYTYWIMQSCVIAAATLQFGIAILVLLCRGVILLIENCGCFGHCFKKETTYNFNDGHNIV